jgi:hypothetical protein
VKPYAEGMSEDQPPERHNSYLTSGGGLFLRVLLVAAVLAGIAGVIWYMNK